MQHLFEFENAEPKVSKHEELGSLQILSGICLRNHEELLIVFAACFGFDLIRKFREFEAYGGFVISKICFFESLSRKIELQFVISVFHLFIYRKIGKRASLCEDRSGNGGTIISLSVSACVVLMSSVTLTIRVCACFFFFCVCASVSGSSSTSYRFSLDIFCLLWAE